MLLDADFGVTLSGEQFSARFLALHKQLFATVEFEFDDVATHVYTPPEGCYQVDHCLFHDGTNWRLFHITGDMRLTDEYVKCFRAGDWDGAAACSVEPGMGCATGPSLFDLTFDRFIDPPSQGRFDMITRSNGWVFRHADRYGMLYGVRGEDFIGFSLAWSDNLTDWAPVGHNPVLFAPAWARPGATCKDAHVLRVDDVFLIYYVTADPDGYCCIGLTTTTDWEAFHDEGCVFRSSPVLRGTLGIESPCVVGRDGMWHLFFTHGPGLWHSVSASPLAFDGRRDPARSCEHGAYFMGHFHATEIVQDPSGRWWLTTDRKEKSRRRNREAGRLCFRGSYEDEKVLEEGLHLCRIRWDGDMPVLSKPRTADPPPTPPECGEESVTSELSGVMPPGE